MWDCVEGQESMASRGQKASHACSHRCIKQGLKVSNMAVHYFEESSPPRAQTHTAALRARWSRPSLTLGQMSKKNSDQRG